MTDVLIRNVSDAELSRIDDRAARLGLSRGEYLRRTVAQVARRDDRPVTASDFDKFASLADDDVMRDAWS